MDGLKELRSVGAPVIGTVLTMVNERRAALYAHEGYSFYRGSFKGYYTE